MIEAPGSLPARGPSVGDVGPKDPRHPAAPTRTGEVCTPVDGEGSPCPLHVRRVSPGPRTTEGPVGTRVEPRPVESGLADHGRLQ